MDFPFLSFASFSFGVFISFLIYWCIHYILDTNPLLHAWYMPAVGFVILFVGGGVLRGFIVH